MVSELTLSVNGARQVVSAAPETPLLFVLRNDLGLTSPHLGCGMAQCGACAVLLDCGKIINPRQLDRCRKSGVVMGLCEALNEEVTFDRAKVTSTNWGRNKILTMEEMPEIKVVQISRDDKGFGGGSEAANAVVPPAVAAGIFDATGARPRRMPLTPAFVTTLVKG